MKIFKQHEWIGGWFVGNFRPAAYRTDSFEVSYKIHNMGDKWPKHYHKIATEINYLIKGKMVIQGETFISGDVFVLEPEEIADPQFLEDCSLIVIKTPSIQNDKYECN